MILFGCIQSQIYVESGAAFSIADTIMRKMLKQGASNTRKNVIAMAVLLAIGIILNLGGITASVVVVLMYPIALTVFEYCDIPKRFILGVLGACSYTFTLTMPGSPQVTNVAAMTSLGTSSWVAPIPGLVGAVVEIVVIIVLLNRFINKARKSDEHFALHPEDPHYDRESSRPGFLKSLLPMVLVFAAFNFLNININLCLLGSILLSLILFWPQLKARDIKLLLPMCHMILKEIYKPLFITTVFATFCGTAAVVLMCTLFPGLT